MSLFTAIADDVLNMFERQFPMSPLPPPAEIEARKANGQWRPASVYYFLEDESARFGQRVKALLRFDRAAVSFWQKRRAIIEALRVLVCLGVVESFQEAVARLELQESSACQ